jgi:5-methylcytosine-specific restriction endonuclease McrA
MAYSKMRGPRLQAAKQKGRHTKAEWLEMQRFYGFRCVKCSKHKSQILCLEKDHIYPIRLGGCDCIGNLQPLCSSCNARKGVSDFTDYRQEARERWGLNG